MDQYCYQALYTRVGGWNALRYEQVFNMELLVELLTEELNETVEAKAPVDILDGRCDQAYVAIGGIWKLNLAEDDIAQAFGEASITLDSAMRTGFALQEFNTAIALNISALLSPALMVTPQQTATILAMICLLNHAAVEQQFDVNFFDAMHIVCDANDSKSVQKVASNIKANIDKGSSFVPPEARLQALLDEVQNVKH